MALRYEQGQHICALYDTESEQLAIATEYVRDGLRRGERCLYVAGSQGALEQLQASLTRRQVDARGAIDRGALVMATHGEAHLRDGHFDSERMLGMLNEAMESALRDGFNGLRCCGDMSWLLGEPSGWQQVVQYEALLNDFFHRAPGAGMCQYDRARLPSSVISDALRTHSTTVDREGHLPNPFFAVESA